MGAPAAARGFVGRNEELAALQRAADAARGGMPSVVLVGGEAGIGKSTLIAEAARRSGAVLYLGRCVHLGGDVIPLAPLMDLLRQIRRSGPPATAGSDELAALSRSLGPSGPTGADTVFVPVLDLVARLAEDGPLMFGVEDLHWADAASWDLFDFLARNLVDEHVVLVGTYRADEIATNPAQRTRLAELMRLPTVERVLLGGLTPADVEACAASILGHPPDPSLVEALLARGQGNPFFTEELLAAHVTGDAIPAVLSDLISADIAGLDDRTRQVLGVIAAMGGSASHDLLKEVADLGDDAVETAMRDAVGRQLVVIDAETDAYRFRHALIGEVIYAELLPSERRRVHGRIADVLRQGPAATLARANALGALAFHLDRAGETSDALHALLAAADAAEVVAPAAAFHHLERAFELWDAAGPDAAGERRGDRLWQAAELAAGAAGNQRAVELAQAAFAFEPPPRGEAWAHERLGRYLWAAGHLEESTAEFERAAALLSAGDGSPDGAPVYAGLAQAELMAGRLDAAEHRCHEVLDLVPAAEDDPYSWGMASRVLGVIRGACGDPEAAVQMSREAVDCAEQAHPRSLATLYLCLSLLDAGRYDDAVTAAADGVAYGHRTGVDLSFGGYMDALGAEGLIRLGRWPEAEELLARHVGVDALPVGAIRLGRARALLAARRGDADLARASLAEAEAQPVDPFHRLFLDAAAAEVHFILGDWDLAADVAQRGMDATPPGAVLWEARFAMHLVNALVEQQLDAQAGGAGAHTDADALEPVARLQGLIAAAQPGPGAPAAADVAAHLAHARAAVTRLTGPEPDAWGSAAEYWEKLSDPWYTAVARLHLAEAAAGAGETARAASALHEAHRVATELGASPLLADAEALSRRTRLSLDAPAAAALDEGSIDRLGLTAREAEVLALVAVGRTNREIGEALYVSDKTASVHVSNILRKLGVTSRVDAAAIAQRLGVG